MRPAPIQMSYIGFPGTIGTDYIDYRVTDEVCPSIAYSVNQFFLSAGI